METAGEEQARATQSLHQLEEAALLLEEASKSQNPEKISSGFPKRVSGILNSLTAISSREDAERLLATGMIPNRCLVPACLRSNDMLTERHSFYYFAGVSMWNAVIAFEGSEQVDDMKKALVQLRHVAADCMYMSTTVLGGISARYNIDDVSLLKFFTACGQKYSTDVGDMDMADVCFSKAAEFVEPALNESRTEYGDKKTFARAMFDLLLGRAECSWEKGDSDQAELFVSDARKYMDDLPGEHEFLASVEYNFGLFTYQAKETERALKWLRKSMETRGSAANITKNIKKQAKTARLAGVCLLALQDYEGSWSMMNEAEETSHDPVGSYLLLKLSVITKKPQALDILVKAVQDTDNSLDICIASISLFGDAQRISDAAVGFEHLFARFRDVPRAISGTVGLRYFETLAALGKIEKAMGMLEVCYTAMAQLKDSDEEDTDDPNVGGIDGEDSLLAVSAKWSALLLATGSAQADRKDFYSAAILLNRCLLLARSSCESLSKGPGSQSASKSIAEVPNVVIENEAAVCRLASSCALCAIDDMHKKRSMAISVDDAPTEIACEKGATDVALLEMSLSNAERAKLLDPSDFAPRLLLFRAYLVANDHHKAAVELRKASMEIRSFDPGALAEAACAARDVGSQVSVIAALRCILNMDPTLLPKNFTSSTTAFPKGFFGKVLLSCVHILLDSKPMKPMDDKETAEDYAELARDQAHEEKMADLLLVMKAGLKGIQTLGVEHTFDDDKDKIHDSVTYLMNVCWNSGRELGTKMEHEKWEAFFDMCYQFSLLLHSNAETLQTRRMSMLMCASSNVENADSKPSDFQKAREQVHEARRVSQMLQDVSPRAGEDPIEGLLLILESRCCVGCQDVNSLACVVEMALQKPAIGPGVLEQLAAVCYNFRVSWKDNEDDESEMRVRCTDLTAALLAKACDVRLCDATPDLNALAVTLREHLGIELSRGSTAARAHAVFAKAIGVVLENQDEFPVDERRWMVAVGWDRAQMFHRLGRHSEAKRWCQGTRQLAERCVALSTYVPRLESFLGKLSQLQ